MAPAKTKKVVSTTKQSNTRMRAKRSGLAQNSRVVTTPAVEVQQAGTGGEVINRDARVRLTGSTRSTAPDLEPSNDELEVNRAAERTMATLEREVALARGEL